KMVGGVMTCQDPAKCGAGIAKGAQAKLSMDYSTNLSRAAEISAIFKSDASKAGIQVSLAGKTFNTIIGSDTNANPRVQMAFYGGLPFHSPRFLPTRAAAF